MHGFLTTPQHIEWSNFLAFSNKKEHDIEVEKLVKTVITVRYLKEQQKKTCFRIFPYTVDE